MGINQIFPNEHGTVLAVPNTAGGRPLSKRKSRKQYVLKVARWILCLERTTNESLSAMRITLRRTTNRIWLSVFHKKPDRSLATSAALNPPSPPTRPSVCGNAIHKRGVAQTVRFSWSLGLASGRRAKPGHPRFWILYFSIWTWAETTRTGKKWRHLPHKTKGIDIEDIAQSAIA